MVYDDAFEEALSLACYFCFVSFFCLPYKSSPKKPRGDELSGSTSAPDDGALLMSVSPYLRRILSAASAPKRIS
jgi:hypothetical protein